MAPWADQVTGGSTNATIHLIAMARSVGVNLSLQDFRRLSHETPFIADLKPSGKYVFLTRITHTPHEPLLSLPIIHTPALPARLS